MGRGLSTALVMSFLTLCVAACGDDGRGAGRGTICSNTCEFRNDGDCDDGAAGWDFNLCTYGTDCSDCGPRPRVAGAGCSNTCRFADDGDCDDGGPLSDFDLCAPGTDCSDCGPR